MNLPESLVSQLPVPERDAWPRITDLQEPHLRDYVARHVLGKLLADRGEVLHYSTRDLEDAFKHTVVVGRDADGRIVLQGARQLPVIDGGS
jgi:hypothetical protein